LDFFIDEYSRLIKAYIRRNVKPNDIDDATQEFFYYILKKNLFAKFEGENEAVFTAYVLRCALNFSSNWRRKEFNVSKALETFDGENPNHWLIIREIDSVHEQAYRNEVLNRLNAAINQLDDQYRAVIELKLLEYTNAEIAEILDEPLGSVNSWYTRGIHILRDKLKDLHTTADEDGLLK
jgi:RNA polymerase sigma factor (sigma-70 family)